ncbi:MAG: DUF2059 domain-containing protein [Alphaproteobacteria bacterium]|nr:DUF2059 domain-containing protein [Alphaproteobacteria bacterium]
MNIKTIVSLILFVLIAAAPALATEDTPEARAKAAAAYLEIVPMSTMLEKMAIEISKNFPKEKRDSFIELMTKHVRADHMENIAKDSMVKHFTVGEIEALRNFYGSPEGRAVMDKMGLYTADIIPAAHAEVKRAMALAAAQQSKENDTPEKSEQEN